PIEPARVGGPPTGWVASRVDRCLTRVQWVTGGFGGEPRRAPGADFNRRRPRPLAPIVTKRTPPRDAAHRRARGPRLHWGRHDGTSEQRTKSRHRRVHWVDRREHLGPAHGSPNRRDIRAT